MASLTFTPLNLSLYRWGGEYSPTTTGPMTRGEGEPLPPPTTIAGAIVAYSATRLGKRYPRDDSLEDLYEALREALDCDRLRLLGPYVRLRGRGRILLHHYPGSLALYERGLLRHLRSVGVAAEDAFVERIGVGLSRENKTVLPGLVYSVRMLDPIAAEQRIIARVLGARRHYEISVDVHGECRGLDSFDMKVLHLGGDFALAKMRVVEESMLIGLLEDMQPRREVYVYTASPILLDYDEASLLIEEEGIRIGDCSIVVPSLSELARLVGDRRLAKAFRAKITLWHPGVGYKRGMPREPRAAVMPGSLLRIQCSSWDSLKRLLLEGFGAGTGLGFATLVPIL